MSSTLPILPLLSISPLLLIPTLLFSSACVFFLFTENNSNLQFPKPHFVTWVDRNDENNSSDVLKKKEEKSGMHDMEKKRNNVVREKKNSILAFYFRNIILKKTTPQRPSPSRPLISISSLAVLSFLFCGNVATSCFFLFFLGTKAVGVSTKDR